MKSGLVFAIALGIFAAGFSAEPAAAQISSATDEEALKLKSYRQAEALRNGREIPRDAQESIRIHRMLAEEGYAPSLFRLGEFYFWGRDIPSDKARAAELFQQSADLGYDLALVSLGRALSSLGRTNESLAVYIFAIEAGVENADLRYAMAQLRGDFGRRSDFKQGFAVVERFAAKKNTQAMLALADAYRKGRGTQPNPERAFELMKQVADTGNPYATRVLGQYIHDGIGTPKNLELAMETYRRAIDLGQDYAWVLLGESLIEAERFDEARDALEKGAALGAFSGELTLAQAHYDNDLGEYSDRAFGGQEIIRLAEAGDVRAGRALLRYHERRSLRLNDADLDLVLSNLAAAADQGDGWATEALLRFYRKLNWLIPDARAKQAEVYEKYGHQLRPARYVPEELWLAYDRNEPRSSVRRVVEMLDAYEEDNFYYGMLELLFIDRNAYTLALQSELKREGFFNGRLNGRMTGQTVRAILRFCEDIGVFDQCKHGPLLFSNAKVIAGGLKDLR